MFRTFRTIARIASIARIAGFGHAPPDWPRFHDTAHRGCSLTHALHPAHCTPAPHTRHTATRHPERKPPAASHTDRTRSRLSALHAAPPRIVRHCLQRDTCSHFAHSPLARATLHSGAAALRVARWPPLLLPFRPLLMSLLTAHAPPSPIGCPTARSTPRSPTRHASATFPRRSRASDRRAQPATSGGAADGQRAAETRAREQTGSAAPPHDLWYVLYLSLIHI